TSNGQTYRKVDSFPPSTMMPSGAASPRPSRCCGLSALGGSMSAKNAATHPLADLYFARALDPVIDLARRVAEDFVLRPQHHTRASTEETAVLANLRLLVGKHPEWPNAVQRSFASSKLFARMCHSFAGIRLSAIRYLQSGSDSAAPIARRA